VIVREKSKGSSWAAAPSRTEKREQKTQAETAPYVRTQQKLLPDFVANARNMFEMSVQTYERAFYSLQ
jgi:hypothetical protein